MCPTFGPIIIHHEDKAVPSDMQGVMLIWFRDGTFKPALKVEALAGGKMFRVTPKRAGGEPYIVGFDWMARIRFVEVL